MVSPPSYLAEWLDALRARGELVGRLVRLAPMNLDDATEMEALFQAGGQESSLWEFHSQMESPSFTFPDLETFTTFYRVRARSGSYFPYTVRSVANGAVVGSYSLLDLRPQAKSFEIGSIWLAPEFQRRGFNSDALFLLNQLGFDHLGLHRISYRCDGVNHRSRRNALAHMAKFDGLLREDTWMRSSKRWRDTAYFSWLEPEWKSGGVRELFASRVDLALQIAKSVPESSGSRVEPTEGDDAFLHTPADFEEWRALCSTTLEGRFVRLEPLTMDGGAHDNLATWEALYEAGGQNRSCWRFHPARTDPETFAFGSLERFLATYRVYLRHANFLTYAVRAKADNRILGSYSFLNSSARSRVTEIGSIWLSDEARGTPANSDALLVMARHAFDVLGCNRVVYQCDARNLRSRKNALAHFFPFESIARSHVIMLSDGHVRDTAIFAWVRSEWIHGDLESKLAHKVEVKISALAKAAM